MNISAVWTRIFVNRPRALISAETYVKNFQGSSSVIGYAAVEQIWTLSVFQLGGH